MSVDTGLVRVTWECPLCSTRRSSIQQAADEPRGRSGLLNHIRHTDDEEHGEWRAIPTALTKSELHACLTVEPVSVGDDTGSS
jgi:hypothetical protein